MNANLELQNTMKYEARFGFRDFHAGGLMDLAGPPKQTGGSLGKTNKVPTVEDARAQGCLILVAEDNPINRNVIRRQLNLLGYACELVEDGAVALAAWREKDYALVLTDCHMPNLDGFELTKAIRKEEEGSEIHIPIIAITANVLRGQRERCLDAGMDAFLAKPIKLKELRDVLEKNMPKE